MKLHTLVLGERGTFVKLLAKGTKLLCVKAQRGEIILYTEEDEEELHFKNHSFQVIYTGEEIPEGKYIGTAVIGEAVRHVYEINL